MILIVQKWLRLALQVLVDLQWSLWDRDEGAWKCPICKEFSLRKRHARNCTLAWLIGADTMEEKPMSTPTDKPCEHEKVYSSFVLASMPPKTPWICRLCGETGIDQEKLAMPKESYDDLLIKFHGRVEAVRRRALQPGVFEVGDSLPGSGEPSDKTP
jgi:hypothetical protein